MKKQILVTSLLSLITINTFAAGNHEEGHGTNAHGNMMKKNTIGHPVESSQAKKVYEVSMLDTMVYEYNEPLNIKSGDVVKFNVTNNGKLRHEFSIGSVSEQLAHKNMMQNMPNMVHEDDQTLTLESGETKSITWMFMGTETAMIACNIPGHAESGMFTNITLK